MKLKFDINALVMVEEMSGGKPLTTILSDESSMMKITTLRLLVWAGLLYENEKLTVRQAGEKLQEFLSSGKKFADIGKIVSDAISDSGLIDKAANESQEPGNPQSA